MQAAGIVSQEFVDAYDRVYDSFRNDFHHLNPDVATRDHVGLAKRNIEDLALIEREIFECTFENGKLVPSNLQYWDTDDGDGTVPVYLRLE